MKKCRFCKETIQKEAICCVHCGSDQRKILGPIWKGISLALTLATFFMSVAIIWQTYIMKRSFELENRPYLYIDITPLTFSHTEKESNTEKEYDNLYVGATLKYKNVGKLPACNIKSETHFYSDMDKGDNFKRLKDWYIKEFGYFPEPTTIFPYQEGQEIPCKVDCSELTKNYLFTIRVSYTGEDPKKIYWYATDVRYSIEKGYFKQKQVLIQEGEKIKQMPGNKEYSVYIVDEKSYYDKDSKVKMPLSLSSPYE